MSRVRREWIATSYKVDGAIAAEDRVILHSAVERYGDLLPQHTDVTMPEFADRIEASGADDASALKVLRKYP
jgi:hypothetical protein